MKNRKTTILQWQALRQVVVLTALFYIVFPSKAPCRCLDCHCCIPTGTVQTNVSCATQCCSYKTGCPCSDKKFSNKALFSSDTEIKKNFLQKEISLAAPIRRSTVPCRCPCFLTRTLTKVSFITPDDVRSFKSSCKKCIFGLHNHTFSVHMLQIDEMSFGNINIYETWISRLYLRLHLIFCVLLN